MVRPAPRARRLPHWPPVNTPHARALGAFAAGLQVVSELLLHELHEATGEPPESVLLRLAILAEHRRGTPSAGSSARPSFRLCLPPAPPAWPDRPPSP